MRATIAVIAAGLVLAGCDMRVEASGAAELPIAPVASQAVAETQAEGAVRIELGSAIFCDVDGTVTETWPDGTVVVTENGCPVAR